ncbi:dTDP-4-dehydrorhamnose reductase family protein [Oceanobacillus chungangensis]|uniref:RmlD-like substrate binding domain-containing protein n=1 Tax=Oceanobacillus chungangensis TaxID=1229152 RepID=A0A3D8PXN0_9BACI|nr:SDR family oxidoreductase [Oceanobacillus chungangensis]RDW20774.1 hypothetical protein CWR45_05995 [Oceanobacillus chungangensis]
MKILLVGANGMLGKALFTHFTKEKLNIITVARNKSDYELDLLFEGEQIIKIIEQEKPDVVVNCAAIVNLKYCEKNPGEAYIINARIPAFIALACKNVNSYYIQISTDHYYTNDNIKQHNELDQVRLLNEYARTKYAGEIFALNYENSLVIRTNILGFRNKLNQPTFIEWIVKSLETNQTITGFDNYYTSSIDIYSFAEILRELIDYRVTGILNIASYDVISKYEFIHSFARHLGYNDLVIKGEMINEKEITRAESLGLNIGKLTYYLKNHTIPTSEEVILKLVKKYKEGAFYELQKSN